MTAGDCRIGLDYLREVLLQHHLPIMLGTVMITGRCRPTVSCRRQTAGLQDGLRLQFRTIRCREPGKVVSYGRFFHVAHLWPNAGLGRQDHPSIFNQAGMPASIGAISLPLKAGRRGVVIADGLNQETRRSRPCRKASNTAIFPSIRSAACSRTSWAAEDGVTPRSMSRFSRSDNRATGRRCLCSFGVRTNTTSQRPRRKR